MTDEQLPPRGSEGDSNTRRPPDFPLHVLKGILSRPRLYIGAVLAYAALCLGYFSLAGDPYPLDVLLQRYTLPAAATLTGLIGAFLIMQELLPKQTTREERFVDVDVRRRATSDAKDFQWLRDKIERLEAESGSISRAGIDEILEAVRGQKATQESDRDVPPILSSTRL
jgi:hypothetical protein